MPRSSLQAGKGLVHVPIPAKLLNPAGNPFFTQALTPCVVRQTPAGLHDCAAAVLHAHAGAGEAPGPRGPGRDAGCCEHSGHNV